MRLLKAMHESERFSPTEQSVIDYILKNPQMVNELSIRELAEKTYTSPAGIFRLCQKLNLKGYTEFKIKFISEYNRVQPQRDRIISRPVTDADKPEDIVRKISVLEIEAIEETRNEMDVEKLARIAEWLDKATIIDIFAFDANYSAAQLTAYNLLQIRCHPMVNFASNSQYMQALNADKTHVALIISRTGENKRLIDIAKILKQKHVKTILFSTDDKSTLAGLCSEMVYIANTIEYLDMGGFIFTVGVRYALDVIFGMLLAKHYKEDEENYDHFEDIFGRIGDTNRLW